MLSVVAKRLSGVVEADNPDKSGTTKIARFDLKVESDSKPFDEIISRNSAQVGNKQRHGN